MTESVQLPFMATDDIASLRVVTSLGATADSGDLAQIGHLIGVTEGAVRTNYQGVVTAQGTIYNLKWNWTPGAIIYLLHKDLSETPDPYGNQQKIGVALTKNVLLVQLG